MKWDKPRFPLSICATAAAASGWLLLLHVLVHNPNTVYLSQLCIGTLATEPEAYMWLRVLHLLSLLLHLLLLPPLPAHHPFAPPPSFHHLPPQSGSQVESVPGHRDRNMGKKMAWFVCII